MGLPWGLRTSTISGVASTEMMLLLGLGLGAVVMSKLFQPKATGYF
jgi:hypothetical protein